ncbi:MAG: dihydroorotase [Acidimicrobiia bacterium]|nr:dihydroorotase [Acidimicrobiia bacterium]
MSDYLLSGGTVLTAAEAVNADVRITDGRIVDIGTHVDAGSAERVDCTGAIVGPGLVDMHVHLREPGQEWKEDIASGSAAAAAGGFTAVVAMPNTAPAIDAGHLARYVSDRGRQVGLVDVIPAGCITAGMDGERLAHLDELAAAGVEVFTDDGHTVADAGLLRRAMEYVAARGAVIAQHAEDPGLARGGHMHEGQISSLLGMAGLPAEAETVVVARDLTLARLTGARYHVQHVSTETTVELIRAAKAEGMDVTAEVAPHHLWFADDIVRTMDPVYKMYPPLRPPSDVAALRSGLEDGTIDAVATDHAPHAAHEKDVPFEEAPRGVIGLETAIAAVAMKCNLDARTLFERMSVTPARISGLVEHGHWLETGHRANIAVVDFAVPWLVDRFESKSTNSPFKGIQLEGRARYTFLSGRMTWRDGKVEA